MMVPQKLQKVQKIVFLALVLFSASGATYTASGSIFFQMTVQASTTVSSPPVILQNGTDNISVIYANNTSAKISANATSIYTAYNYSLNIENRESSTRLIALETFNYTGISKINTTIGFYDNNTFEEQIIIAGENVTEIGGDYNLIGFSTIHIKIENLVENNPNGVAYLYVYLRIKIPNTLTYMLYTITFEFE